MWPPRSSGIWASTALASASTAGTRAARARARSRTSVDRKVSPIACIRVWACWSTWQRRLAQTGVAGRAPVVRGRAAAARRRWRARRASRTGPAGGQQGGGRGVGLLGEGQGEVGGGDLGVAGGLCLALGEGERLGDLGGGLELHGSSVSCVGARDDGQSQVTTPPKLRLFRSTSCCTGHQPNGWYSGNPCDASYRWISS